ncbi:MAG TPA: FG-GAP-like repeat-containing protein, partial [Patescibacteria group bacterium]|nr:FG-GAP-like repeat-containing protein [Patescibacteria group bacterium]
GDFNGDGRNEIAAGVASGGAGQIRFFGIPKNKAALVLMNPGFFAFNRTIKNGLSIAAHDVDGDGLDDIIAGQGGGGSTIRAFNQKGKRLMDEFLAYSLYFKGGITVAAGYRR